MGHIMIISSHKLNTLNNKRINEMALKPVLSVILLRGDSTNSI